MADEELPGRAEWLVLRRAVGAPLAQWTFYRSSASAARALKTLAGLTAWRWPVETVIEECKGELGLDYYEVRSCIGWHHHTTMMFLAHHFLVRLRVNRGIAAPALTVAQVRRLLQVVLPKREFNAQETLEELARIQQQNHAAYRSHKKRRWRERKSPPPNYRCSAIYSAGRGRQQRTIFIRDVYSEAVIVTNNHPYPAACDAVN